jgi:hypothetical protein
MNYFVENTPYSSFQQDCDDDILIEVIDDENFPPSTMDDDEWYEDEADYIEEEWSWLM